MSQRENNVLGWGKGRLRRRVALVGILSFRQDLLIVFFGVWGGGEGRVSCLLLVHNRVRRGCVRNLRKQPQRRARVCECTNMGVGISCCCWGFEHKLKQTGQKTDQRTSTSPPRSSSRRRRAPRRRARSFLFSSSISVRDSRASSASRSARRAFVIADVTSSS